MGSNNGTGQPNYFRCSKCRSTLRAGDGGWVGDVTLTGRKRDHKGKAGARNSFIDREYVCDICGHTGWSCHFDLAVKAGESQDMMMDDDGNLYHPSWARPARG